MIKAISDWQPLVKGTQAESPAQYHFCGSLLFWNSTKTGNPGPEELVVLPAVKSIDGLHPVIDVQLFINMINMFTDRFLTNVKLGCNFLVKQAFG